MDDAIEQHRALHVFDDLLHFDIQGTVRLFSDRKRSYLRVESYPLTRPVRADLRVPMNDAAFHAIGPHDVLAHHGEDRVDAARIERGVDVSQQLLSEGHVRALRAIRLTPHSLYLDPLTRHHLVQRV